MNEIRAHTVTLSSFPSHIFSPPSNTAKFISPPTLPLTSLNTGKSEHPNTQTHKRKKLLSRDIYQVKWGVILCCSVVGSLMLRKKEVEREREKEGETLTGLVSIRKCWGGWKVLITRTKNKCISFSLFTRLSFPLLVLVALKITTSAQRKWNWNSANEPQEGSGTFNNHARNRLHERLYTSNERFLDIFRR